MKLLEEESGLSKYASLEEQLFKRYTLCITHSVLLLVLQAVTHLKMCRKYFSKVFASSLETLLYKVLQTNATARFRFVRFNFHLVHPFESVYQLAVRQTLLRADSRRARLVSQSDLRARGCCQARSSGQKVCTSSCSYSHNDQKPNWKLFTAS